MITFLPDPIYSKSAKILDNKRLGKQRVECLQLIKMLIGVSPWNTKFVPALGMWQGYEYWLSAYTKQIIEEWKKRGFVDSLLPIVFDYEDQYPKKFKNNGNPFWEQDQKLYASHRSNLLRKNPDHYKQFDWCESYNLPYYWPKPIHAFAITNTNVQSNAGLYNYSFNVPTITVTSSTFVPTGQVWMLNSPLENQESKSLQQLQDLYYQKINASFGYETKPKK